MNIAVVFGGESCEHDISIITGVQLINNMNKYLYNVVPIYIDKSGNWLTGETLKDIDNYPNNLGKLSKCSMIPNDNYLYFISKNRKSAKRKILIDMAFLCLHGVRGEDGSVASVFELSKVPYFASSICSSSVCMDKVIFKHFAKGLGVKVVDGIEVTEDEFLNQKDIVVERINTLKYPIIVKPARLGSSIGISVCEKEEEFEKTLKSAFLYDKSVLIEKFIPVKKEVNIAIFDKKGEYVLSNTEEPLTAEKFLNFDDKYRQNTGGFETIKRVMPASISDDQNNEMIAMVTKVYSALKMFGVVRFDFLVDKDDEIYLNEVNTIPGSMSNYLFNKQKYPYSKLIELWISNAVFRCDKEKQLIRTLNTDVLNDGFDGFKK